MAYKDSDLNKGQLRKLNAYRKSVKGNEKAAQGMFKIYMDAQPVKAAAKADKVAIKLGPVDNHRAAMIAATRLRFAAKLESVLSYRVAIARNSLIFAK